MTLSDDPHPSLARPYEARYSNRATEMIKFLGHPLADADYSYFQTVIDKVDLYESNTSPPPFLLQRESIE